MKHKGIIGMKYKGIEIKEFKSEKPVVFDPPRKMFVWNDDYSEPSKDEVLAFIPKANFPVIGSYYTFDHCAEIPDSEQATVIQLAEWVSKGFGLIKKSGYVTNYVSAEESDEHRPVSDCILVRKWGEKEWHKPTREYIGLENEQMELNEFDYKEQGRDHIGE